MFITVGMPSSRRTGPTCRIAGCIAGANMNTMPASSSARVAISTGASSCTPSCSSTSALPHCDVNERLPCFAMRTPAPAASSAAAVEMLNVGTAPPPVPHVSTRSSARCDGQAHHRAAQRARRAGDLLRRLALHAKPDEQRGDLRRGRLAAHDRAERLGRERPRRANRRTRSGESPSAARSALARTGRSCGCLARRRSFRRAASRSDAFVATSAITSASSRTRSTSSSTNTPYCARFVRFTTPTSSPW